MAINKEDYLYISSLLRAREPRMLSRDKAERMLDAPNFEDAAKMLTDSGYEDMSPRSPIVVPQCSMNWKRWSRTRLRWICSA